MEPPSLLSLAICLPYGVAIRFDVNTVFVRRSVSVMYACVGLDSEFDGTANQIPSRSLPLPSAQKP
jgi:hypothetical protein